MESKQQSEQRFALLIDAENVSAKYIKPILSELSKYGTVTYKRIYGDWTQSLHARWKDALLENSITPIQQFSYTSGKNSTDSAMIIDAMDILYADSVEGFCLVSSDSDFTRLASRLRESGVTVIGMGERKTPKPFRTACDIFTTLEVIQAHHRKVERQSDSAAPSAEEVEQAVVDIITDNTNNGKSTGLGEVGSRLLKVYPDFDVRSFGTGPLSQLLEQFNRVTVIRDGNNINVELSEASASEDKDETADKSATTQPAAKPAREAEGTRRRRPRSRKTLKGAETADTAPATEEPKAPAPAADAAPTKVADETPTKAADETPTKGADEAPTKAAPADEPKAETAAEEAPQRPARRRGRPRKHAVAETPAAETKADDAKTAEKAPAKSDKPAKAAKDDKPAKDAKAAKADKDDKPAKPAKADKPAAETADAAKLADAKTDADAKAAPKRRGRKPRKTGTPADEASDPKSYIRELVKASGAEGVDINVLNRQLRSRFRGFKIRDLGYTRMNAYIEAQRGMTVVTRDEDAFAVLKSALKGVK